MTGESISSIGSYNGFDSAYNPALMAMMNGYGGYGLSNPMMSSMMMNPAMMMMNPAMMMSSNNNADGTNPYMNALKQIYSANGEIQKMNIQQQSELHEAKEKAQLHNSQVHDDTFIETAMKMGEFETDVRNLYDAIRDGNGKEATKKFYTLRQEILNRYGDKFNDVNGGINKKSKLDNMICTLYSEYGKGYANDGSIPDLRYDVKAFGDSYLWNGIRTTFMGNHENNNLTGEEQIQQMFGTDITNKGSKEKARDAGKMVGHAAELATAGGVGAAAGATAWTLKKLFTPGWLSKAVPEKIATNGFYKWTGKLGTFIKGGALGVALIDAAWQLTRA